MRQNNKRIFRVKNRNRKSRWVLTLSSLRENRSSVAGGGSRTFLNSCLPKNENQRPRVSR